MIAEDGIADSLSGILKSPMDINNQKTIHSEVVYTKLKKDVLEYAIHVRGASKNTSKKTTANYFQFWHNLKFPAWTKAAMVCWNEGIHGYHMTSIDVHWWTKWRWYSKWRKQSQTNYQDTWGCPQFNYSGKRITVSIHQWNTIETHYTLWGKNSYTWQNGNYTYYGGR